MAEQNSIKQLEADLWSAADVLRSSANLNANQYCMPVLGLLFLKYAYGRYKKVEAEMMKNRPTRNGVEEAAVSGSVRLPFGLPGVNKDKQIGNANYLWIQYFYAYLNETGRAGFVMASSATDSQNKDRIIREKLVKTGHVDCLISVANNFFYILTLPCTLCFFDKNKREENRDKILFIDSRNYYTVVEKTLNEWNQWQMKNINAIVWLYRGETEKYKELIASYKMYLGDYLSRYDNAALRPAEKTHAALRDGIQATGYRVNSHRDVQFRQWATQVLKEYMIKGFVLNDELLKNAGQGNYFDELLARIRDIRSSEKMFYRKVYNRYPIVAA